MVGCIRKAFPEGREWSRGPFGRSGGHPGGPGVVARLSRRAGSGQEAHPVGRE